MAIDYAEVEFSLAAPLDQSVNPATPALVMQRVRDGCYDTQGAIHKRPGLDALTATATLSSVRRLIPQGSGVVAVGRSSAVNTLASWQAGTVDDWDKSDEVSEAVVERRTFARDLAEPLTEAEVAIGTNWIVYVWTRTPVVGNPAVWIRVVDRTTGAVKTNALINANARACRVLASADGARVFVVYLSGTNLIARTCDTAAGGTLTSETTLSTVISQIHYDILPNASTGFHFLGINTSNDLQYYLVSNALAVGTNWTVAGTFRRPSFDLNTDGTLGIAVYNVGTLVYEVYNIDGTGFVVAGPTTLDTIEPRTQGGVKWVTQLSLLVTWSESTASGDVYKYNTWDLSAVGTRVNLFRLACTSRIWTVSDGLRTRFYQWARDDSSKTLVLLNLEQSTREQPRAVATAAFGLVTAYGNNLTAVAPDGAGAYRIAAITAILAQDTAITAADEVMADFGDLDLFSSAVFGPATYLAGGVVQQLTGRYADEHAFLQLPKLTAVDAAGNQLTAGATYTFALVYEYQDDLGLVHRSVAATTTVGPITDRGGGLGGATLTLWPLTLTRRTRVFSGSFRTAPIVLLGIYQSDGSNAEVLYRSYTFGTTPDTLENDPTDIVPVTIAAVGTSLANPRLYTTGGVLENDAIWGGARGLCVHKSRLFAWGGEERDVVWYSQEHVNADPPLFSLAQQIRVPGEIVVACASLDDALVIFTRERIYAVYGDGPNSMGDPASGSFSLPIPITTETGAVSARLVNSKRGVYFRGRQGAYLLDRGRQLVYVGGPVQTEFATYSITHSVTQMGARGEIRWVLNNGSAGVTLVYDETSDRWMTWTHRNSAVLEDALYLDGQWYAAAAGDLYRENPATRSDQNSSGSTTYFPALSIQTNDLDFGSGQAQKRCRRIRAMVRSQANGVPDHSGLQLQLQVDGDPGVTESLTFGPTAVETAIDAAPNNGRPWYGFRFKPTKQKFQRLAVTLQEVTAVDPGMTFLGLAFEVGAEGGLRRTPANASM